MKLFICILLLLGLQVDRLSADNPPTLEPNYALAERFSRTKVARMVFSTAVGPNWFEHSDKFWYTYSTPDGTRYYVVDPVKKTKTELFDPDRLAAEITLITKHPFDAQNLKLSRLKLEEDRYFTFTVYGCSKQVDKKDKEGKIIKGQKKTVNYKFRWNYVTQKLTDISEEEIYRYPSWANISPDGRYAVFAKDFNLFYMDRENLEKARKDSQDSTIVEHRLTTEGREEFAFGGGVKIRDRKEGKRDTSKRFSVPIRWSPDSKHFAVIRKDESRVKELWVVHSLAQPRPTLQEYKYQLPGEPGPQSYLYLFDMESKTSKQIRVAAYKDQALLEIKPPGQAKDAYKAYKTSVWAGDNEKFYFYRQSRDLKRLDLCAVYLQEDSCRRIVHEELNAYVEYRMPRFVSGGSEIIQWSERDGWAHLYLYDDRGNLKHAITSGPYHVEDVVCVDEKARVVYFIANGKEKGMNPYYTFLYRVNFDGSGLQLLNRGDFDNTVHLSDNGKYFVNNYSRVDCAPRSALYDCRGRKIMELEEADLSQLFLAGYRFPERFTVKADDGITDLYGVMYKPFDFDSTRQYPLIEYVYPGPQTEANKSSWTMPDDPTDRLAQIGFVVITVGNRGGHPGRSKWYHNYGYGNLRDYGLEDKKAVAQKLAARYGFIDLDKVGIQGHSGGGFMSTAALLKYPDFFKVAVSSAGNHDNRIYNRWWSEQHHGIREVIGAKGDTTFQFSISTNQELAKNLKGHLLLMAGEVDDNVHPGNTYRMADALMKANKRFDMLIVPGLGHGFTEYCFWKMADYFAEYLLGKSQKTIDIPQMNNN